MLAEAIDHIGNKNATWKDEPIGIRDQKKEKKSLKKKNVLFFFFFFAFLINSVLLPRNC